MKIAGIIAEYNPFHNGHALQIRRTREQAGCDYVVVCMTGHYTQRGEAACLDKWTRAQAALCCGADAVFELPALFAVRTADAFARGGVHILGQLGCDVLSFGTEEDDGALLERLADLRMQEPAEMTARIRLALDSGATLARARADAAESVLGLPAGTLKRPNLTLAVEYICANRAAARPMTICTVRREGDYHDERLGEIASASAIRAALRAGDPAVMQAVPGCVRDTLAGATGAHAGDDILLYQLRTTSAPELKAILDVGEGLENRILRLAQSAPTRAALVDELVSRRYTRARISRILTAFQLHITREFAAAHPQPEYARLIGLGANAGDLMGELNKRSAIKICADSMALKGNSVFELECRATDLWSLARNAPEERLAGREFTQNFVRILP